MLNDVPQVHLATVPFGMTSQTGFSPRPAGSPSQPGTVRDYTAFPVCDSFLWRKSRYEGFHFKQNSPA